MCWCLLSVQVLLVGATTVEGYNLNFVQQGLVTLHCVTKK